MAGRRLLLLLLAAAFLAVDAAAGGGRARSKPSSAVFPLIHRKQANWAELARSDRRRMSFIKSRGRRRAAEAGRTPPTAKPHSAAPAAAEAFAMPLSSGAYTGTGQYFVRFRVGTPAQPFLLVADTGSDLTWVKCRRPAGAVDASAPAPAPDAGYGYGAPAWNGSGYSSSPAAQERVFRPEESRTWAPIPCSSDTCVASLPFSLAACPTPGSPCAYDYRYKDGSAARGTVGTDSATIALSGRGAAASAAATARNKQKQAKAKLRGVVLGCTTSYNGDSFQASDGVLSLGYSNISFASHAADRFGGRFSYCLVDHLAPRNATSYLTFGPNPALSPPPRPARPTKPACAGSSPPPAPPPPLPGARQTPLLLDHRMRPFYAVTVNGISVDGELLKIPRRVWDIEKGGGAILDSGTSLTVLARPAYRAVVAALSEKLAGLPRVAMDPFEYCYNWTSPATGEDLTAAEIAVPELAVHLAGSARLQPPAKSYVIDAAPGVKCIGVQEGEWPGVSVIGNILQQEHLWEFDIKNRRLRFKRSRCTQ